jgi:hypothetical protein
MADKIGELGNQDAAKENYLNSPLDLNSLGERMKSFAQKNGLPLDRPTSLKELMSNGYVMFNDTGEKERVIIQVCGDKDWRDKSLITADELLQSKKDTLPEGITDEQLKEIEIDMDLFIDEVQHATQVNEHLGGRGVGSTSNKMNLVAMELGVFETIKNNGKLNFDIKQVFIRDAQNEVRKKYKIPNEVRGIPVEKLARRGESKANGHGCPVIDCPHVFSGTGGVLIYDGEGHFTSEPKTIRINSVVAHLAGHGISETGKAAVDQSYISIRDYLPIFDRRAESVISDAVDEKIVALEVYVKSTVKWLNEAGITTVTEEEIEKFGKEQLFFMND